MNVKKLIRAVLKLPLTPFYVGGKLALLSVGIVVLFFEWVYDKNRVYSAQELLVEELEQLKRWFTTI